MGIEPMDLWSLTMMMMMMMTYICMYVSHTFDQFFQKTSFYSILLSTTVGVLN